MTPATHRVPLRLTALILTALLSGCSPPSQLQPFTTDGCSRFPDRSLTGKADWCGCCVSHDLAYWRGGTAQERLNADIALKECVQQASGDAALAVVMYRGVRAGGGPEFTTRYRWGYGWPYGRGFAPLSAEEQASAAKLEAEYRAANSPLSCPP